MVLAGDFDGNRILKAAELVRAGLCPEGAGQRPAGIYGFYECDLAIPFAEWPAIRNRTFLHFRNRGAFDHGRSRLSRRSCASWAQSAFCWSPATFTRAGRGRFFDALRPIWSLYVVAAPDPDFSRRTHWWHNREGRKMFVMEWMKTVAEWLGL